MTSSARSCPLSVSVTPWYGVCSTRPSSAIRRTIADADAGLTPTRSAIAPVLTAPSSRSRR